MGNHLGGSAERRPKRIAVFVDSCNAYTGAKETFNNDTLDYDELLHYITEGRTLIAATAYVVSDPSNPEEDEFFSTIACYGYRLERMKIKIREDGTRKGNWDVGLALDAIEMASELDIVVLVSGDGDFVPLIQKLRQKGCRTIVMSFKINLAPELTAEADEVILLDDPRFRYRSPNGGEPSTIVDGADST